MNAQATLNVERVCDPHASVVVSACAGSGKTWLLVARLIRILLNDESPRSILALTFTRKAAQEMHERLYQLLHEWTLLGDADLLKELQERGLNEEQARALMPKARALYERLLSDPYTIAIDTFHGWFGNLLAGSPVSMGAQQGFTLREDAKRLQQECLEDWWAEMPAEIEAHYEYLLDQLGAHETHQFLMGSNSLLRQKGAWVFFEQACQAQDQNPHEVLKQSFNQLAIPNPLLAKLKDSRALAELQLLCDGLMNGGTNDQKLGSELQIAIEHLSIKDLDAALVATLPAFMTLSESPSYRKDNDKVSNELQKYLTKINQDSEQFISIRQAWGRACEQYIEWQAQHQALKLNEAWFAVSAAIFKHTQRAKERLRVRDFDDLELGVAQMITDPRVAAYLQARLDARYQQILIDEFQDTNPLQWQILKAWLAAYGDDHAKPKVFIVGDPKQSIYRFRRADPRLFIAATHFLREHFDAHLELQNTTRRNAPEIVNAINQIFSTANLPNSYPFQTHHTLWSAPINGELKDSYKEGEAYCLPMVPYIEELQTHRTGHALETPFIDPRETPAKRQRITEGQRVAALIHHVIATRLVLDEEVDPNSTRQKRKIWRRARPGDFLLLVKRRQYLPQYEEALRQANLLFDSPRLGGLLETLEVDDLIALLTILGNPSHDLALAQVLRSPLYGLNEDQMQTLAELVQSNQGYRNWWEALSYSIENQQGHPFKEQFQSIAKQISEWMDLAKHLPVHDLLDHIYHAGDLRYKYASACQESDRDQVLANLDAFLELALNLDGGRYPSLGRFIAQLNQMRRGDEDETPDEGEMSSENYGDEEFGDDVEDTAANDESDSESIANRQQRVRLMTIHGAKGLEAPFVIVLDTNNTAMPNFGRGILLDWDPDTNAPHHLSMFTKTTLSQARSHFKEQEKGIGLHENWNLLYVALSRAKQGLWLSGVESSKNRQQNGLLKDSWYDRAMLASTPLFEELNLDQMIASSQPLQGTSRASSDEGTFEYHDIVLGWQGDTAPIKNMEPISMEQQRRMDEGDWFHQVMQRITPQQYRPVVDVSPSAHSISRLLNITEADALKTLQRAQQVCDCKDLIQYFDPSLYIDAWNELDLINQEGKSLRVDRLVEFENELVILDYKLSIPDQNDPLYAQYQNQLSHYREALKPIHPSKSIKTLLIDSQGRNIQFH